MAIVLLACRSAGATDAEPQRIISLAPSLTETVFALGLGDRLVGVSTYCDYPPAARRIDRVGTFLTPNIEAILAKRPDVVLAVPSPGNESHVEALQRLGVRVLTVDPSTVAEIESMLVTVGRELGREAAGRQLAESTRRRMSAVQARVADAPLRKVIMVVGQTPLMAVGSGTFQSELIDMARGLNVAARAGGSWPRLSIEFAIAAAPEVIIDTTMGDEERLGAEAATGFWNGFPTIPAVRSGHVYGYHAYEILRPGPRVADAFETIARFIHPERFAEEPSAESNGGT